MAAAFGRWAVVAALRRRLLALSACSAPGGSFVPTFCAPAVGAERPMLDRQRDTEESEKIVKLPATAGGTRLPGGRHLRRRRDGARRRRRPATTCATSSTSPTSRANATRRAPQFALKIGVAGRLLIGPAGSPGAYSTTLHVRVKREADGKAVFAKTFQRRRRTPTAPCRRPSASSRSPILLPLTRARLDDDYSITVGLGAGGAPLAHPHHRGAKQTG